MKKNNYCLHLIKLTYTTVILSLFSAGGTLKADSDIELVSFVFNPQEWVETYAPEQILFTIKNNGPDDWVQDENEPPRVLKLNFGHSLDDSTGEDDELVVTFNAPLELGAGAEMPLELFGIHRSQLIVPSREEPYYWYLNLETEGFTDPDPDNNTLFAPLPSTVLPAPEGMWATFSGPEIQTSNIEVFPADCFVFNQYYGNNWRIQCNDGDTGFSAVFQSEEEKEVELIVTHLSSGAAQCPGGGYSPVTIAINGENIVEEYDPAENHGFSHGYVTDSWVIPAVKGENVLEWYGEETCTHYWIQHLEIGPVKQIIQLSMLKKTDGTADLMISCPAETTINVQSSVDLETWETLTTIENSKEQETVSLGNINQSENRFYRAQVD